MLRDWAQKASRGGCCYLQHFRPFFSGNQHLVYAKRPKSKNMSPHGIRGTANPLQPARTKSTFGLPYFRRFAARFSTIDFCEIVETAANTSESGSGPAPRGRRMAGGWSSRLRAVRTFKNRPKKMKIHQKPKTAKSAVRYSQIALLGGSGGGRIEAYRRIFFRTVSQNSLVFL